MPKLTIAEDERLMFDLVGADMDLVEQLVEMRKLRGMTQTDVAEGMGVDRSVVSRFESITGFGAKNHTMRTARKYADAVHAYIAHLVVDGQSNEYRELAAVVSENLSELRRKNDAHEQTVPAIPLEELRSLISLAADDRGESEEKLSLTFEASFGELEGKEAFS